MEGSGSVSIHLQEKVTKASQMIGWILRTFRARDRFTILTLYKSLVLPHLEYCSIICTGGIDWKNLVLVLLSGLVQKNDGRWRCLTKGAYVVIWARFQISPFELPSFLICLSRQSSVFSPIEKPSLRLGKRPEYDFCLSKCTSTFFEK